MPLCVSMIRRIAFIFIIMAVVSAAAITPILLKLKVLDLPISYVLLGYPSPLFDVFSWHRGLWVLGCAAVSFLGLLLLREKIDLRDWPFWGLALMIPAAFFPMLQKVNWILGVPYLFESGLTVLAYFLLAFAARRVACITHARILPWALGFATILASILGVMESKGEILIHNPWFESTFLTSSALTVYYQQSFPSASLPFGNPNYVGAFAAMVWPFFLGLSLICKGRMDKILFGIVAAFAFALLIASGTRAAYIAGGFSTIFGLWILLTKKELSVAPALLLFVAHLAAFEWQAYRQRFDMNQRILSIASEWKGMFSQEPGAFSQISSENGRILIEKNNIKMRIDRELDGVRFLDEKYRPLRFHKDGARLAFHDSRYEVFSVHTQKVNDDEIIQINEHRLIPTKSGIKVIRGNFLVTPRIPERFPLPISDDSLSFRGYIWSRTLPLLADSVLIGRGAGSFPFEFPNDDANGINRNWGLRGMVDKPHSLYLSFAHSYGLVALLLLLLIFMRFLRAFLRSMLPDVRLNPAVVPYGLAFIGFTIVSLSNDSTIGVSAPFWILFGTGLGLLEREVDSTIPL